MRPRPSDDPVMNTRATPAPLLIVPPYQTCVLINASCTWAASFPRPIGVIEAKRRERTATRSKTTGSPQLPPVVVVTRISSLWMTCIPNSLDEIEASSAIYLARRPRIPTCRPLRTWPGTQARAAVALSCDFCTDFAPELAAPKGEPGDSNCGLAEMTWIGCPRRSNATVGSSHVSSAAAAAPWASLLSSSAAARAFGRYLILGRSSREIGRSPFLFFSCHCTEPTA